MASVIGAVLAGDACGIWYGAVLRADINRIVLGSRVNVQDGCVLHVEASQPLIIGDDVTIGHRAIVHGCTIGNRVLVGMGAIIMNGVVIGDECIIGAGALVTEGTVIPSRSVVMGAPAKVKRELTAADESYILGSTKHYAEYAAYYRAQGLSVR